MDKEKQNKVPPGISTNSRPPTGEPPVMINIRPPADLEPPTIKL